MRRPKAIQISTWERNIGQNSIAEAGHKGIIARRCKQKFHSTLFVPRRAEHTKCPSCMIGKSTLEDLPKLKDRAKEPLHQLEVNMDIFSSSVQSIEGHNYAVVLVDCNTGYRCLYGMKLKSDMLKVVKKWYSDIANLRQKHKLLVVMRDNAG